MLFSNYTQSFIIIKGIISMLKPEKIDFDTFKSEQLKFVNAVYLRNMLDSTRRDLNIHINPNDHLVDRKSVIDEFKAHSTYQLVREDDGFTEERWVSTPEFKNKTLSDYSALSYENRLKAQRKIEDQIYDTVLYETTVEGKTLSKSSAKKLLSELDHITYIRINDDLRLNISALAKTPEELTEFKEHIQNNKGVIFHYRLLGEESDMISELLSSNANYERFNSEVQEHLKDFFFNKTKNFNQLREMTLQGAMDRKNISKLSTEILNDPRMTQLDIDITNPELKRHYYHYEGIIKNIETYLNIKQHQKGFLDFEDIDDSLHTLKFMVKVGVFDNPEQFETLKKELANSEDSFKKKELSSVLENIVECVEDQLNLRELNLIKHISERTQKLTQMKDLELLKKYSPSELNKIGERFINNTKQDQHQKILSHIGEEPNYFTKLLVNKINEHVYDEKDTNKLSSKKIKLR